MAYLRIPKTTVLSPKVIGDDEEKEGQPIYQNTIDVGLWNRVIAFREWDIYLNLVMGRQTGISPHEGS